MTDAKRQVPRKWKISMRVRMCSLRWRGWGARRITPQTRRYRGRSTCRKCVRAVVLMFALPQAPDIWFVFLRCLCVVVCSRPKARGTFSRSLRGYVPLSSIVLLLRSLLSSCHAFQLFQLFVRVLMLNVFGRARSGLVRAPSALRKRCGSLDSDDAAGMEISSDEDERGDSDSAPEVVCRLCSLFVVAFLSVVIAVVCHCLPSFVVVVWVVAIALACYCIDFDAISCLSGRPRSAHDERRLSATMPTAAAVTTTTTTVAAAVTNRATAITAHISVRHQKLRLNRPHGPLLPLRRKRRQRHKSRASAVVRCRSRIKRFDAPPLQRQQPRSALWPRPRRRRESKRRPRRR